MAGTAFNVINISEAGNILSGTKKPTTRSEVTQELIALHHFLEKIWVGGISYLLFAQRC